MPVIPHPISETPMPRTPEPRTVIPLAYADWLFRALHGAPLQPLDMGTIPSLPTIEISDSLFARCVTAAYGPASDPLLRDTDDGSLDGTLGVDLGSDPAFEQPYEPSPPTLKAPRFEPIGLAARVKDKSNGRNRNKPAQKPEGVGPHPA